MIDEGARTRLADLAMRALDKIEAEYGEEAELTAAVLVFEVKTEDGWDGNYEALHGQSPHHTGGLAMSMAEYIMAPNEKGDV